MQFLVRMSNTRKQSTDSIQVADAENDQASSGSNMGDWVESAMFVDALDSMLVIDCESGEILAANKATERVFGYNPSNIIGQHYACQQRCCG